MSDDLIDIAGGDTRRADVLREHLAQLSDSNNADLREMARAVLRGEVTLREAALSDAYGKALGEAFDAFWAKYQQMSSEKRDELRDFGLQYIERPDVGVPSPY